MKLDDKINKLWAAAAACGWARGAREEREECGMEGVYEPCDGAENKCSSYKEAEAIAQELQAELNILRGMKKEEPTILHGGGRLGKKK